MGSIRSEKTRITGQQNKSPLYNYAVKYKDLVTDILTEETVDLNRNPERALRNPQALSMIKDFFIEESYDPAQFKNVNELKEFKEDMGLLFENDVEGLLENTVSNDYSPLIGMSTIMHKYILMNTVYDKGGIQKFVTDTPSYTITHQYRYLVTPEGEYIDLFKEQNKITKAINATNPTKIIEFNLPEIGATNIIDLLDGTSQDRLSNVTELVAFKISDVVFEIGDTLPNDQGYIVPGGPVAEAETIADVWYKLTVPFTTTYETNSYSRMLMREVAVTVKVKEGVDVVTKDITDTISIGITDKDRLEANSIRGIVKGIRIFTRLDTTNAMINTCRPAWKVGTITESIPDALPINITISPDEVKDIGALYKIDQLAEMMTIIKEVMVQYKDDTIKEKLDISYENLPERSKEFGKFDYAPRQGYLDSHVSWIRDTFYFFFDSFITKLYQIYNDPNLTVTIFGDPDMVRKVTPVEVVYNSPAAIGPVDLDFFKKTSTSDKRTYNWIGSDKNRGDNEFAIILSPTNNNQRITYRIVDYMMYISNEIRNNANPNLPAVHAYERWRFSEYQPVQARLEILNPSGLRPDELPDNIRSKSVNP